MAGWSTAVLDGLHQERGNLGVPLQNSVSSLPVSATPAGVATIIEPVMASSGTLNVNPVKLQLNLVSTSNPANSPVMSRQSEGKPTP